MERNGWIKYFLDGTKEFGPDEATFVGEASWRFGRLENMVAAELMHEGNLLRISGEPSAFWQADTFQATLEEGKKLVARHISRQITNKDCAVAVNIRPAWATVEFLSSKEAKKRRGAVPLKGKTGQWAILTIDLEAGIISLSLSEKKI